MTNTLGLDDDLDGIEVLRSIERSFALTISDETAGSLLTVGDIHDELIMQLGSTGDRPGGCATAMAFYRLRRALRLEGATGPIHVDTDLALGEWPSVRRLWKRMESEFDLRPPPSRETTMGLIGFFAVIGGLLAILPAHVAGTVEWLPYLVMGVGVVTIRLDPRRMPSDCRTVGELATTIARLNRGPLVAQGAASRMSDIWDDLVEVLSEHSILPKSEIRVDTLLLQSRADRSRAA